MSTFHLKVVTPTAGFFEGEVDGLIVRTTEGDVGILAGHTQYLAAVGTGALKIKQNGQTKVAAVSGGFLQVGAENTTLITISCQWLEDIDVNAATAEKEQAQSWLETSSTIEEKNMARAAVKRAENKIRLGENK